MSELDIIKRDFLEYKHSVKDIKLYHSPDLKHIYVFKGKQKSCSKLITCVSHDDFLLKCDTVLKEQHDLNIQNEKHLKDKQILGKINREKVKIGDIFNTSWGYEQTNVEFFQVIDKPTPCKVLIRQISRVLEETQFMSGTVLPIRDDFIGDAKLCNIKYTGEIANIDDYKNTGYRTEQGKKYHCSWYA